MKRSVWAIVGIAAVCWACGGAQGPQASAGAPGAAAPAATPAGQRTATTAAAGGAEIGVAECDSYVKNYLACLDGKVPESARGMLRMSFDQARAHWKQAAATPEGRAGLALACTQADTVAKQALAAYGCRW
jgi:hypothetical protein